MLLLHTKLLLQKKPKPISKTVMTTKPTNPIVPRGTPDEDSCGEKDRLGSLPDSIICHILSFLPTKFAAATSILSTRWRYIFLSVPKIDLDDSLILHPDKQEDGNDNDDKRAQLFESFMDLVNRLVSCEKISSVIEFRVKLRERVDGNVLVSWMSLILGRNVQVLDIWLISLVNARPLPIEFFSCKTLVVMKLSGKILLEIPKLMCLPNLKVLHLEYLVVVSGDNTRWTFSESCPLLEDLRVDTIQFWTNAFVDISIPSLRKLVWHPLVRDKVDEVVIVINSANLEYLEYKARVHPSSSICKLNSLVRADLYVGYIDFQRKSSQQWARWLSRFLSNMCGVKSLDLLLGSLEGLFHCNYPVPKFPNLTCMELMVSFDYHWEWLEILLQHTPNLELLVCDMAGCRYTGAALVYGAKEKPLCLTQYLREVTIKSFCGDEFELQLVRYLLQHGAKLEVVSIYPSLIGMSKGSQPVISEKLLNFSRCSKNCNIVFME